jgi:dUTP pyrophosphatase
MDIKITTVCIKKLNENATIPSYETAGAAGFDLRSCHGGSIQPGQIQCVSTGLAMEIPEGYELQVRPRSGLALKNGITVLNSPGTVDSDYRGEIKVILINHGNYIFTYTTGQRIAQGVLMKLPQRPIFYETQELSETDRGLGGFGSTGL